MQSLPTKALSKHELNRRNDRKASSRYEMRRNIDKKRDELALEKQLRDLEL